MSKIVVEHENILDYVKYVFSNLKNDFQDIENAKYHHNSKYENAVSICRYGILTVDDLKKIKDYSPEELLKLQDTESHVNGSDAVSLSVIGLDDLYKNELEYYPFSPDVVDFLITSEIDVSRSTHHYGNKYLVYSSITSDKIKSIDIRFLELIKSLGYHAHYDEISKVIQKYNYLRELAIAINELQLNIPIREMSSDNCFSLDIEKLAKTPQLIIK